MKTVRVDFSQGLRGGLVRANLRRASEPLVVGDEVKAFDLEDDLEFIGTVCRIDEDGRFAYLEMDWQDAAHQPLTFDVNLSALHTVDCDLMPSVEVPERSVPTFASHASRSEEVFQAFWHSIEGAAIDLWTQRSHPPDETDERSATLQLMLAR